MTLFKNYTFSWKELGVFKLALLSIGVILGALWHEFFVANMTTLVIVAVISSACIIYVSLKK